MVSSLRLGFQSDALPTELFPYGIKLAPGFSVGRSTNQSPSILKQTGFVPTELFPLLFPFGIKLWTQHCRSVLLRVELDMKGSL